MEVLSSLGLEGLYLPTPAEFLYFPAYVAIIWVLTLLVPGYYHKGAPLADKRVITYKINGLQILVIITALFFWSVHKGWIKGTEIYDRFWGILVTVNFYCFLVSFFLYWKGVSNKKGTGRPVHDFIVGTELMPFVLGMPLKFFWLKPAMMGWLLVNYSFLVQHFTTFHTVHLGMACYQIFTGIYVLDYFFFEENMTSTWDIISENFGWMLVWGDAVFIPFFFSIQCWHLVQTDTDMPLEALVLLMALFLTGYTIFRTANNQKHAFKKNPNAHIWGAPPQVIGGRLLVSGFWGLSRHANYLGDIIMSISFSLGSGFSSFIPYAYPLYLIILLVHRERRDEDKCRQKYKTMWAEYCRAVPYRIVPGVY
mmetsp:Transcript_27921/g.70037  ORF Transcript_27921/g.70037 Transcript_27921/m.70037 type:complete len:366 (+) Transcript_27921:86-1183(+)